MDQTSSVTRADKGWDITKTVTFESNAVKLRVCGSDHDPSHSDYTVAAGFLMACDDGGVGSAWGDTVSDTSSGWSARAYSDASFAWAITSSPLTPVESSSGFYCPGCGLSSTSRTPKKIWHKKIWPNDAQYVCFTYTLVDNSPVFEVDFGDASHQSMYTLHEGAYIGSLDNIEALRVGNGKYATLPININPSSMTDCTIEIWFKLLTVPQHNGWLVSTDDIHGWYDRGVIVHDERFGGGVAPIPGATYNSGLPAPTLNEWSHVVVVYRQGGESAAFLNGVKSNTHSPTSNGDGLTTLNVGTIPHHGGSHAADAWVKSITIWNEALSDVFVHGMRWDPQGSPWVG